MLVLVGGIAVDAQYRSAGDRISVTNESWSADPGNVTTLSDSNLNVEYDRSVEVRNSNLDPMLAGEDYEWIDDNGTVKALSSGRLSDGESAFINYSYANPSDSQDGLAQLAAGQFEIAKYVALLLVVAALVAALATFTRL